MTEKQIRMFFGNIEKTISINDLKEAADLDPAVPLSYEDTQELIDWYYKRVFLPSIASCGWEEVEVYV